MTAYLLSASICTPIMGRIGDMLGKRGVLVFTLPALSLGSLLAAIATNITVMIIARVIQGVGGGALPLSFGINGCGRRGGPPLAPRSSVRSGGTVSWLPAVLLSAWLVCLLLAMNQAPAWGGGSPVVIGLLSAALVLAGSSPFPSANPGPDAEQFRDMLAVREKG